MAGLLLAASPAAAQLSRAGVTKPLIPGALLFGDVAHDPQNDVYLSVIAWGTLWGAFAGADGTPISTFTIPTPSGAVPRVAYGPHLNGGKGGFLVTFHQLDGPANFVHSAVVAYPAGVVSVDGVAPHLAATHGTTVSGGALSAPQGGGPSIAYSPEAKKFLVAWTGDGWSTKGRLVNGVTGVPEGGVISVVGPVGTQAPAAAWNPQTQEFAVGYAGHAGYMALVRVNTVGTVVGTTGPFGQSAGNFNTALAVTSAGRYVLGWASQGRGAVSLELDSSGNPLAGFPTLISSQLGTPTSFAFALNPVSGTILAVSEGVVTREVPGVELSSAGVPLGIAVPLTDGAGATGAGGSYAPRVGAHQTGKHWSISYSRYNGGYLLVNQIVTTGSTDPASAPTKQALAVQTNPVSAVSRLGNTVTFTASATGRPTPSVQWQAKAPDAANFSNIAGATSASLPVFATADRAGTRFRAAFSNTHETVFSGEASLIVAPTANDFDGDGRSDAIVFRPSTGGWWGLSGDNQVIQVPRFGAVGDIPLSGDLDGDGLTDMVIWRPNTGGWFWLLSSIQYTGGGTTTFGGLGDVPLLGDFDGDRRADLIVWRPSIGTWFWLTSSSNYNPSAAGSRQWGIGSLGDMPLIGDFDGDGRTDLTVWRAIEGNFYWLTSSSSYATHHHFTFGGLGDQPFLTDFDGDGRADITVYRPSNGTWYWRTSAGAFGQRVFGGGGGDVPLLTDVDGDTKADITIWRPRSGEWFWLTSSSGHTMVRTRVFGGLGDIPLVR